MQLRPDVKIGDADAGLEIDPALLLLDAADPSLPQSQLLQHQALTSHQKTLLASLPPVEILAARVHAYNINNDHLKDQAGQLKSRSMELEKKLRRVVALCTGVAEDKVDGMLGGLVVAVESEKGEDVEVGRVREFLRKVEGV